MKIRITFTEEILGTLPNNDDIYREYIASKAPDAATTEEEVAMLGVDAAAEKGITVFPKKADGSPFLYDYQIKGFFKDACSMLSRAGKGGSKIGKESASLKAFKKIIDGMIFVAPREIPINMHGMMMDYCSRPLRANTPQGERVSLVKSETCPAGSTLEFEVLCLDPAHEKAVTEWLDYGTLRGIGQWRNSGKGKFTYERLD